MDSSPFCLRVKRIDAYGNETTTSTRTECGAGNALRLLTVVVQAPESDANHAEIRVSRNGLIQSQQSKTGLVTAYTYDTIGRRLTANNTETGTTTTGYEPATGRVCSVTSTQSVVTYTYDGAGRVASKTDSYGTEHYTYTDRGELSKTWGQTSYPVWYEYDGYARKVKMHTYRSGDFTGSEWPSGAGDGDVTTWVYEEATGLLLEKVYADATEQEPSISYTYTTDGKLVTRTWKRDGGLTTTYSYHDGTAGTLNTGELRQVSYSDGTPQTTFTYDRLGRKRSVADAVGSRTFTYGDNAGATTPELLTESINSGGGGLYGKTISRTYEDGSGNSVAGRSSGFYVGTDYAVTYDYYATTGRIQRVIGPGLDPTYGAVYNYVTNSALRDRLEFRSSADAVLAAAQWEYEFNADADPTSRRAIRSVENTVTLPTARTISKYTYTNGAESRRDNVTYTGEAFANAKLDAWSYNPRQELTGTAVEQPVGTALPAQNRAYAFDPIGNRTQSTVGTGNPLFYCVNNVNQYMETDYDAPDCPSPEETFGHDADGNLAYDGTFLYEWDGENRLEAVYKADPTTGDRKLVFDYDYMSRRVRMRAFAWTGSAWPDPQTDPPAEDLRFVYDEWNVIMVLDGLDNNAVTRKYTWGLDLSGGFHDAGGIGGLLAVEETGGAYPGAFWYFYDANGNVGQIVKGFRASLPIAARYEYDAYGNALVATGVYADANPFRFSTKWRDSETGLYYYGYRYYSPRLGRWCSRDPIQEADELLLYSFVRNNALSEIDLWGLEKKCDDFCYDSCMDGTGDSDYCTQQCCYDPDSFPDPCMRCLAECGITSPSCDCSAACAPNPDGNWCSPMKLTPAQCGQIYAACVQGIADTASKLRIEGRAGCAALALISPPVAFACYMAVEQEVHAFEEAGYRQCREQFSRCLDNSE